MTTSSFKKVKNMWFFHLQTSKNDIKAIHWNWHSNF